MRETGIIMSGHHPVDILEGRKTMTRRLWGLSIINDPPQRDSGWQLVAMFLDGCARFATPDGNGDITLECPYGGVYDRLWVKETLYRNPYLDEAGYVADNSAVMVNRTIGEMLKWRWQKDTLSSMFMPRNASRILLEITEIRAERLRAITPADAIAEGGYTVEEYITLFLKLNKLPEDANPWLWPISFRLVR